MTINNKDLTIRLAISEDVPAIVEIYNESVRDTTATFDTEPKTAEQQLEWLKAHGQRHPVIVAVFEQQVIGWAALSKWSERPAYNQTAETSFYVAEKFRGRGIGRALKRTLIKEAKRLGFHTLLARVAEGNEASLYLNESLDFELIGTMKEVGFKFGKRLDVHLMQLMLRDGEKSSGK
ncbi:MAG TPA: GNAT family N-acetyltransferase [Planctomycetaceae bacterium]|nr:GNAT family N-acetyltransferase [Planctomycetaceae bacterium]